MLLRVIHRHISLSVNLRVDLAVMPMSNVTANLYFKKKNNLLDSAQNYLYMSKTFSFPVKIL